jgi:hypothetical protein
MEPIYTLQDFMLFTKSVTYLIVVAALIGFPAYWLFLTGRDEKKYRDHE